MMTRDSEGNERVGDEGQYVMEPVTKKYLQQHAGL